MKKLRFKKRGNILYYGYDNKFKSSGMKDTKVNRNIVLNKFNNGYLNDSLGISVDNIKIPIIDTFLDIVMVEKERTLKTVSYNTYEVMYRKHILPYFKGMLLSDIKPIDIKKWQDELLKQNLKKEVFVTSRVILKAVFDEAILFEYVTSNPITVIKVPKMNYIKKKSLPFTLDEIDLLLNNADRELKNFLAISFFTGMRSGELLALKWSDINFNTLSIDITKNLSLGKITSPKTPSSVRNIEMIEQVIFYFKNQMLLTGLKNSFIFLHNNKMHYSNTKFFYRYKLLLKLLKLDSRALHNTRHTFASIMLNNHIEPYWVSNMLGHESLRITLDIYSKYIPRTEVKRIKFLEERYKSGTNDI